MKSLLSTALFSTALLLAAPALALDEKGQAKDSPAAVTKDNYPLTTCVVSDDKLGEMGKPFEYTCKQAGKPDRLVLFCCKDCIADFEKEPAKYLKKLDDAIAARAKK